jgi:tRNA A-37 threonylcarbamoyl transferase component Bud32
MWQHGTPRSLAEYVTSAGPLAADDLVALVRVDQRERWERGERPPAESYLRLQPIAAAGPDVALDVIFSEVMLRGDLKESPKLDEYLRRFPSFEVALRRLFAVNQALESSQPAGSTIGSMTRSYSGPGPAPATPDVPAAVGKYRIITSLGAGGQATVYRALHPTLGKDVVLKLSHEPTAPDQAARDRLVSEGRALAELDHPHLARVYDLDWYEGRAFLVMEYVPGRNLEQYARQEHPSPRQVAVLVARVARALAVAHRRGVLHLDVKPRNIVIDEAGAPRLIDFGMSRLQHAFADDLVAPGTVSGTVAYMAPEQARGDSERLGPCSDVFALGGVLYFLLTGHAPYQGGSIEDALEQARRGSWDRMSRRKPAIAERLAAICSHAMALEPAERYAQAEAMAGDLEAFADTDKPRRFLALAGGLVLALVAVLLYLAWTKFNSGDRAQPDANVPLQASAPGAIEPHSLLVRVIRNEKAQDLINGLPVRRGDFLQVDAVVPPGFHGSLFSFTSQGKWELLDKAPARESSTRLRLGAQLDDEPGTEFLLLCGRRAAPMDKATMESIWGPKDQLPALPGHAVWRLDRDVVYQVQPDSGGVGSAEVLSKLGKGSRGFVTAKARPDPEADVRRRLEDLGNRLRSQCEVVQGIAFSHRP